MTYAVIVPTWKRKQGWPKGVLNLPLDLALEHFQSFASIHGAQPGDLPEIIPMNQYRDRFSGRPVEAYGPMDAAEQRGDERRDGGL